MSISSIVLSILIGLLMRRVIIKLMVRVFIWRKRMKDKEFAGRFWKRTAIVASSVALAAAVLILAISAVTINADMKDLLEKPVDEYTMYHINRMDERIANLGAAGKLLVRNQDRYETLKQENDRFIDDEAARLIEAIDKLQPVEKFESYEHMKQVETEIMALRINTYRLTGEQDNDYCAELERRVTNYSKLQDCEAAYKDLVNECKEKCPECNIAGYVISDCSTCGGEGSTQVFNDGRKIECRECRGGGQNMEKCTACVKGYIYNFE